MSALFRLFCGEGSEALLEYRPCWKAHAARVRVEIQQLLPVPHGSILYLSYALAYYGVCGRVSWPVPLVRWEQLVVDHALLQARLLTRPLDKLHKTLFAGVIPHITDDPQEPHNPPQPGIEVVLVHNS